jgi:hypothetical protein
MPIVRITNGFDNLSDSKLVTRASEIVRNMIDNPNFSQPDPPLADITDAIQEFQAAMVNALTRIKYQVDFKDQKRQELIDMMHNLSNYVLYKSKLNAGIAASSGFSIVRQPTASPDITKPLNVKLSDGVNPGELEVSFDKVPAAKSYLYQYTKEPLTATSVWESKNGTVRKTTLKNLQSKVSYYVRIAALGVNDQIAYSDIVSRVVQ